MLERAGIPDESCAPYENARHTCDALHICANVKANPKTHDHQWPRNEWVLNGLVRIHVENPRLYYVETTTRIAANDTLGIMRRSNRGDRGDPIGAG